ncbi:biotin transporter BioY [Corynebacterium sp. 13CS0277]|uniref:biotin transporter BioY n=1 Tax=Corynebacterium sp. 13CS0277 TaxID=2071994 RepID=UPI000D02EF0D|nr:biotin transporter BioY [Corynebacterium sp. 13CS0277]PRQ10543.1 biotin transporter BioY [Corynebacterium sp. 13CS0277]
MTSTPQRTIATTAVFAALIIASSLVSIPAPGGVPIVLQNAFCVLAGLVLGPKRGTLPVVVFLVLGLVGLPVLPGSRTVLSAIAGPTAGYLIGYLFSPMVAGLLSAPFLRKPNKAVMTFGVALACLLTIVVQYICGVAGLMVVSGMSFGDAVVAQLTYIPGAIIKTIVMTIATVAVLRALPGIREDLQRTPTAAAHV